MFYHKNGKEKKSNDKDTRLTRQYMYHDRSIKRTVYSAFQNCHRVKLKLSSFYTIHPEKTWACASWLLSWHFFFLSFLILGTHWIWEIVSMVMSGKAEYETRKKEALMIEFQ